MEGAAPIMRWVLIVVVLFMAGCDGEERAPAPAAVVGGHEVDERQVRQWVAPFARPEVRTGKADAPVSLDACIRTVRRNVQVAPRSRARRRAAWQASRADGLCRDSLREARRAALGFLIRTKWLGMEARERAIAVTDSEVRRELVKRKATLGGAMTMRNYLQHSGMTRRQFEERVRRDVLFKKVMVAAIGRVSRVKYRKVAKVYGRDWESFRQKRARDLQVLVTRSRSSALGARSQVRAGAPWGAVARRVSVDASKRTGGRISIDVSNNIPVLRRAVFSTPIGRVAGPIEIRGLWWVFRPLREHPPRQMSLSEVAPRIRASIRSTREQRSVDRFVLLLDRKYRGQTTCIGHNAAPECGRARPSVP